MEQTGSQGSPKPGVPRGAMPPRRSPYRSLWIYLAIVAALFAFNLLFSGPQTTETNWQDVRFNMLDKGYVARMVGVRNKGTVEVYLNDKGVAMLQKRLPSGFMQSGRGPHFYFTIGSVESFEQRLHEAQADKKPEEQIYPTYEERPDYFSIILTWVLPIALLVLIWVFLMRRMSSGIGGGAGSSIFNIGKSKAQLFNKSEYVKVDFSDVAGMEEAKMEVMEIIDFLKNPKKYTELGGKIPKGALLIGPPGTGKTLLAKAVAGEANVPFFSLSGSDFMEMFVGVGVSRVRDLFKQAKEKAPCIIFIDEIDSIGRTRARGGSFSGGAEERENTLNQLLTEMDGFSTNQGVIVLAATNRADILDSALLRPGRFDRQIHVELPDYREREAIFKVHMRTLKLEKDFDVVFLAKQTPGFSGADIANVCNEAALIAARRNGKEIVRQDFLDAIDRVVGGLERKSKILTSEEKRKVAYHEAGHATVSWFLEHASPLLKVSIIPRGRSLGAAWYVPEERQLNTREQLFQEMCALLGGRASESVVFGEISTGALNDLERVNKLAYAMVAYYGMAPEMENACYYDSSGQQDYSFTKPYSESTAQSIDNQVKILVSKAYEEARSILRAHREGLEQLAQQLLDKEVIFAEDLEKIYGPRKSHTREEELAASINPAGEVDEKIPKGEAHGGEVPTPEGAGGAQE